MPKKLSFEDFEEEIEGPKEKKVEKVKVEKKVAPSRPAKVEKSAVKTKTAAKPKKPAAPSKPVKPAALKPTATPSTISPSAYFKTAAASKRHAWTWAEFGKKATCSHAGCKASMNWAAGKRGGIIHFYLIEGDSTPRDRVPGCPCARVGEKPVVAGKAKK